MKNKKNIILTFVMIGLATILYLYLNQGSNKEYENADNGSNLNLDVPNPSTEDLEENKLKMYKKNSFDNPLKYKDVDNSSSHLIRDSQEENDTNNNTQPNQQSDAREENLGNLDVINPRSLNTQELHNGTDNKVNLTSHNSSIDSQGYKSNNTSNNSINNSIEPNKKTSSKGKISAKIKKRKSTKTRRNQLQENDTIANINRKVKNYTKTPNTKKISPKKTGFSTVKLSREKENGKKQSIKEVNVCITTVYNTQMLQRTGKSIKVILVKDALIFGQLWKKGKILYATTVGKNGGLGFVLKKAIQVNGKSKEILLQGYDENDRSTFFVSEKQSKTFNNELGKQMKNYMINKYVPLPNDLPVLSNTIRESRSTRNTKEIEVPEGLYIKFK